MKLHLKQNWTSQRSRNSVQAIIAAGNVTRVPRTTATMVPPLRPSQDVKYTPRGSGRALTHAHEEERRVNGLCFRCDEKFVPGHRCTKLMRLVMLIDGLEEAKDKIVDEDE